MRAGAEEFPTEIGLALQHLKAVFDMGSSFGSLSHQQGGGGVVDEVVEKERGKRSVESREVERGIVDIRVHAYRSGIDDKS